MSQPQRALIIFPTYNEADNIEKIVHAVLPLDPRIHVLIVDDNSPDGTGQIADRLVAEDENVNVLHREKKEGLGRAYLAGFRWAIERKYDFIFEMDADFSHGPEYIRDFLKEIQEHDLVLGSRYISGVNVINWPMSRLLLSYGANVYTRIITGLPLRDATGGFKCFRREVLEALDLDAVTASGYSFQIEMSMRVWKKGFSIKEIPIIFVDRTAGESKMSKKIMREAIWMVWLLRLKSMFGKLG
ncbi:MAG: polyprenol monophosphomannose synthase [candidate division Zixibacteria bacterium]|nr:polyprenol monophosphomannose synthase [candidate division Zixibacteria bacterium]MDH3936817.1 polyprenol monophosphomannose synthase [candidate division Zixibacteria bacterium]MDH4033890.1 polyprenol monophosphomannose synthase [candidate division Zixibacteria bacterium]